MESSLFVKQTTGLTIHQQMCQALHILQLPMESLAALIAQAFLENPLLEIAEEVETTQAQEEETQQEICFALIENVEAAARQGFFAEQVETQSFVASPRTELFAPVALSLEEELLREVAMAFPAEDDRAIAVFLIGSLNQNGYLETPLQEVARATGQDVQRVQAVLHVLQTWEPAGVGARNLQECLRLQAQRCNLYEGTLRILIDRHLPNLAHHRFWEIAQKEGLSILAVQQAVDVLRKFNPKPGASYAQTPTPFVLPDAIVYKMGYDYQVHIVEGVAPRLQISSFYQQNMDMDEETRNYVQQHLKSAVGFIKNITQRRETLQAVLEAIVAVQTPAIIYGQEALRPLSMRDVAAMCHLHPSTVSRAVANKYVELPRGLVAMRDFFTGGIDEDKLLSAQQVRQKIEEIIQAEDPCHPLSDSKITSFLHAKKMPVARRTVMKYREQLGYPSSMQRRRYE